MNVKYTNINHDARLKLGLDLVSYCIASSVYTLSNNPSAMVPGWCNAKRNYLAEFLGVSKRTIQNHIAKLIEDGILIKNEYDHLKTSQLWYDENEISRGESFASWVKKLHPKGEKVAPQGVKKLHPLYNVYNYIDNDIDIIHPKKLLNQNLKNSIPEIIANFNRSENWLSNIKSTIGIPAAADLTKKIEEFLNMAINTNKSYDGESELKKHFFYWLKKNHDGIEVSNVKGIDYSDKNKMERLFQAIYNSMKTKNYNGYTNIDTDLKDFISIKINDRTLHTDIEKLKIEFEKYLQTT